MISTVEALAAFDIQKPDAEEREGDDDEDQIEHQNFTSSAKVTRFSELRRSGVKPGTFEPGAP